MIKRIATILMAAVLGVSMCFTISPVVGGMSYAADGGVTAKSVTKKAKNYTVQLVQDKVNYLPVTVTLPKYKKLKKAKISKIKVTFEMKNGSTVTTSKTTTVKFNKKKTFKVTAPNYGKFNVKLKFYKGKKLKKTVTVIGLGIVAEEYNIAMHDGSISPLMFTLSLIGGVDSSNPNVGVKTKTEAGDPVPTFLSASRDYMYNWKYMPENTYRNPLMKSSSAGSLQQKTEGMAAYAKMLKSLNGNSKFHFYITDDNIVGVDKIIYMNQFKDESFDLVLITDGTRSASEFNRFYSGSDAQSVYDSMLKEWQTMIEAQRSGQTYAWTRLSKIHGDESFDNFGLSYYAYAAVSAPNATWWVSRPAQFQSADSAFLAQAKSKMIQMGVGNMNNRLNSLTQIGKVDQFKKLLKFDEDMFADAIKNNKKKLVLFGTIVNNGNEANSDQLFAYLKKMYSDEYEIYYKGHPNTPTGLYPAKQQQLDANGVHDIESSLPAELILFYFPDIKACGLSPSTLNQSYKEDQGLVYMNARLANRFNGGTNSPYHMFEEYFNRVTDSFEDNIKELCIEGDENYLIEYNKEVKENPCDIAIYDYTKDTIKYYVLDEETAKYIEVDKDGNVLETEVVVDPDNEPGEDGGVVPPGDNGDANAEDGADALAEGAEVQPQE